MQVERTAIGLRTGRASCISTAIQRVTGIGTVPENEVEVRPVANSWELQDVYHLTHEAYLERGYCDARPDGRLIHYPHLDAAPETTVFVAVENGETVGTISLTQDGEAGLPEDADFPEECMQIRGEGRTMAAAWRLVTSSRCRSERKVVLALIRAVMMRVFERRVRTCLFTFNPRHERIYQRLLNMQTVARRGETKGLKRAPAVLMRCDHENLPEWAKAIAAYSRAV